MSVANTETSTLPAVLLYARLLRKNHELIAEGKGDSPEAEALAEQMDAAWHALTPQEQKRMRGLSEDLYALREGGPKRIEMPAEDLAEWQSAARDAYAKLELGIVDDALAFFRKPIPSSLPYHVIPFLQARCLEKLGDQETAEIFRQQAERLEPLLSGDKQQTLVAVPTPLVPAVREMIARNGGQ